MILPWRLTTLFCSNSYYVYGLLSLSVYPIFQILTNPQDNPITLTAVHKLQKNSTISFKLREYLQQINVLIKSR